MNGRSAIKVHALLPIFGDSRGTVLWIFTGRGCTGKRDVEGSFSFKANVRPSESPLPPSRRFKCRPVTQCGCPVQCSRGVAVPSVRIGRVDEFRKEVLGDREVLAPRRPRLNADRPAAEAMYPRAYPATDRSHAQ